MSNRRRKPLNRKAGKPTVRPMAMTPRSLLIPAAPIVVIDEPLVLLAERMRATLGPLHGYALAAPQVGQSIQLVVSDSRLQGRGKQSWPHVILNPTIRETSGRLVADKEGCLSLPGRWYEVERYEHVVFDYVDVDGRELTAEASGLAARLWQHETDHLAGLILAGRYPEIGR